MSQQLHKDPHLPLIERQLPSRRRLFLGHGLMVGMAFLAILWLQPSVYLFLARDTLPASGFRNTLAACGATAIAILFVILPLLWTRAFRKKTEDSFRVDVSALRELVARLSQKVSMILLGVRHDKQLGPLLGEMAESAERATIAAEALERDYSGHARNNRSSARSSSGLIILFDAHDTSRRWIRSTLAQGGFNVLAFGHPELAKDAFFSQADSVHSICASWDGVNFEAPEFIAGVRRAHREIPIALLIEGRVGADEAKHVLQGPGKALRMPREPSELLAEIRGLYR